MKKKLITNAFLIGSCIAASLAFGQDILLEGKVLSRSATIPAGASSAVLYEVPQNKKLIVTQFCKNSSPGPELFGSKLGRVPAGFEICTTYVPGVLFKKGETVSCVAEFPNPDFDTVCLINGVLQI